MTVRVNITSVFIFYFNYFNNENYRILINSDQSDRNQV